MYQKEDIRVGSIVIAPGESGDTYYKVLSIGTNLLGEDSFLGEDLRMYPCKQVLSCSLIKSIHQY